MLLYNNICTINNQLNVGRYTIHGSYGLLKTFTCFIASGFSIRCIRLLYVIVLYYCHLFPHWLIEQKQIRTTSYIILADE